VVDDEADVAKVLTHHLTHHGFTTTVAGSMAAARDHLNAQSWELVIVDVILPGGDGRDLLPDLRSLDPAPVVIMTSVLTRYDLDLEPGDAYLFKPFRSADVEAVLAAAGVAPTGTSQP
jgi:DNA-binding response OmpR family regulator